VALTIANIQTRNRGVFDAAISPDARWIAVTASGAAGTGVYLLAVDGSAGPKFWIAGGAPAWYPDSKRIVFSRNNDLWSVAVGSSTPTD